MSTGIMPAVVQALIYGARKYVVSPFLTTSSNPRTTGKAITKNMFPSKLDLTGDLKSIQYLLNAFLIINILQLVGTIALWRLDVHKKRLVAATSLLASVNLRDSDALDSQTSTQTTESESFEEGHPLLTESAVRPTYGHVKETSRTQQLLQRGMANSESEKARGRIFTFLAAVFILLAWVVFFTAVIMRLKARRAGVGLSTSAIAF